MNLTEKNAFLSILFLFTFISIAPLAAESSMSGTDSEIEADTATDAETETPQNDDYYRSLEYLLSEEFLQSDEFTQSEEYLLFTEDSADEELTFDDETDSDEEPLSADEPPLFDDFDSFFDEYWPDSANPELSLENTPAEEEPLPDFDSDDDIIPGNYSLFLEAPPLIYEVPQFIYEIRSFSDLFSGFSRSQINQIFSEEGFKHYIEKNETPLLIPNPDSGIDILSAVMAKKPSHIIEVLTVVPYSQRELDILDIYNALGNIGNIKDHPLVFSGNEYYIFPESTRIASDKNRKAIADPPPADTLPYAETLYLRLKEAYFGNLFLRGDISMSLYGMTYSLTNFTDVRYFLLPVMKAERFSVVLYLEPLKEGVLAYCMSGLYLPGFIADRVNLTNSINYRISVIMNWVSDNLYKQGGITAEPEPELINTIAD